MTLPSGVIDTSVYNGDGLRVEKEHGSAGKEKFIWDGENYLMETDAAGATKAAYTQRPGAVGKRLISRKETT